MGEVACELGILKNMRRGVDVLNPVKEEFGEEPEISQTEAVLAKACVSCQGGAGREYL